MSISNHPSIEFPMLGLQLAASFGRERGGAASGSTLHQGGGRVDEDFLRLPTAFALTVVMLSGLGPRAGGGKLAQLLDAIAYLV
jgi:hypothetical protein